MERNIAFCCDGTANQKGGINTNVVNLLWRISTTAHQIPAYECGVGTFSPLGFERPTSAGRTFPTQVVGCV